MNCKEVDFKHPDLLPADYVRLRHSNETCNYVLLLSRPDEEVQIFDVARHLNAPSELISGVFESEVANVIFDVVVLKEFLQFFHLGVILDVERTPFKTVWKLQGLLRDFILIEMLDLTLLDDLSSCGYDGLRVPEFVLTEDLNDVFVLVPLLEMEALVVDHRLEARKHLFLAKIR